MANVTWMYSALKAAGLDVQGYGNWANIGQSDGTFAPFAVVMHHDASVPGDSYGVRDAMQNLNNNGAQIWIDRRGTIWMIASGRMWHAGAATNGRAGISSWEWNAKSIGVETDHTTGEDWPQAQYNAMVACAGVLLGYMGQLPNGDRLVGHKEIQAGNPDPDGIDMNVFRADVAKYMRGEGLPTDSGVDMPLNRQDIIAIVEGVRKEVLTTKPTDDYRPVDGLSVTDALREIRIELAELRSMVENGSTGNGPSADAIANAVYAKFDTDGDGQLNLK